MGECGGERAIFNRGEAISGLANEMDPSLREYNICLQRLCAIMCNK